MAETSVGRIVRIAGPVIDVAFPVEQLPEIYFALEVEQGEGKLPLVLEVQQHLGNGVVRTVAMDSSDGLRRGTLARLWRRTGKPLYNFVTRRLLRTRDGESRRPSTGPWPRWVAARGPRR